jgi:hypothetical protein
MKRQSQYGACDCVREAMVSRMTGLHARDAGRRSDALCACCRDTAVLLASGSYPSVRASGQLELAGAFRKSKPYHLPAGPDGPAPHGT